MKKTCQESRQMQQAWNLFRLLAKRDNYTGKHSLHVAYMALNMSRYIEGHFGKEKLFISGLLHDIGKIEFPNYLFDNYIVNSKEDYNVIKKHPYYSKKILDGCGFDKEIVQVAYTHHERCNGSGYPLGLKEKEISIESQMIAILDSFSAVSKDRPYKKGVHNSELALTKLMENPEQYNKELLSIFEENITSITNINHYEQKNVWDSWL